MCWLSKLLRVNKLTIPYPEEKPDYTKTLENTDIASVLTEWLIKYRVLPQFWDYWRTEGVWISLTNEISYAAGVYELDGKRYMNIRPEWLNPGVIAHEQAHNSFSLLSDNQKLEFGFAYTLVKNTDPLIKLLYKTNAYGLTSDVEGHAEIYRYLADKMPEVLKQYYPKLIGG